MIFQIRSKDTAVHVVEFYLTIFLVYILLYVPIFYRLVNVLWSTNVPTEQLLVPSFQ